MIVAGNTQGLPPKVLSAVSVFLCPLKMEAKRVEELSKGWKILSSGEENILPNDEISLFRDNQRQEETIHFGKDGRITAVVRPKIAWVPGYDWVVLVLEATLDAQDLYLNDLLMFNVGFRKSQGGPEPQDSSFDMDMDDLKLSDRTPSSAVYDRLSRDILKEYSHLKNLKKSLLLCCGTFERSLRDDELCRFGTIAYPQEPVTPEWLCQLTPYMYDRWKSAGWRSFVYSYSLVYALDGSQKGRKDESIRDRFLYDYVKMGIAIAIQRAWLQEFPKRLRDADDLKDLQLRHKELVQIQSSFGVRWTPEGTQRMTIEEMWRKATGVDDRMSEIKELLEQKVDLFEAIETKRVNVAVIVLQLIFGFIAGAQIGAELPQIGVDFLPKGVLIIGSAFTGLLLCWLFSRMTRYNLKDKTNE